MRHHFLFIRSQLCVAGTFQGVVGRDVCDACPQGSANDAEGSETCAPCVPETFASDAGLTQCEACDPGMYQDKTGKASCVDCLAGTQNPLAASDDASACVACPAGTLCAAEGTAEPTPCILGHGCSGGVVTAACATGQYSNRESGGDDPARTPVA